MTGNETPNTGETALPSLAGASGSVCGDCGGAGCDDCDWDGTEATRQQLRAEEAEGKRPADYPISCGTFRCGCGQVHPRYKEYQILLPNGKVKRGLCRKCYEAQNEKLSD